MVLKNLALAVLKFGGEVKKGIMLNGGDETGFFG